MESEHRWGFGDEDVRWLDAAEASARIAAAGVLGGLYTPHCARVHPARLVRGLADAVERQGATIYEQSRVVDLAPGTVGTAGGRVRAERVVHRDRGLHARDSPAASAHVAPVYSLMIATEPLPARVWDEIGWAGRETLADGRHLIIYAQRTADDRIAFGGRGAPYHFGSRIRDDFDRDRDGVRRPARRCSPSSSPRSAGARITHEWGGPLGVPRDWYSSVGFDRATGVGWAGGYVGDGVSTTNLAGRTLADLLLGIDSELTALPWVNHRSPHVGARAAAVARDQRRAAPPDRRRPPRGAHRTPSRWRERLLAKLVG